MAKEAPPQLDPKQGSDAPDIPALILAAGVARRMRGTDKLLEKVRGVPLLRAKVEDALACDMAAYVTLPGPEHPRWQLLDGLPVTRVPVPNAHRGMAASLGAGLHALPPRARRVMILLSDLPELSAEHLRTMLDAAKAHPDAPALRGATEDGRAGHPVILSLTFKDQLLGLEGDRGAGAILKTLPVVKITLPGTVAITDLDTPEDWAAWRAAQREQGH